MSIIDNVTEQAGRLLGDVQQSLRRARLEGERRVLERQHRTALEQLGAKVAELIRQGRLPQTELASEFATVESKVMEIDAKNEEIAAIRDAETGDEDASPEGPEGEAGPGWEAAKRFFPRS